MWMICRRKYNLSRVLSTLTVPPNYQRAIDHVPSFQRILGIEKVQVEDIEQYQCDWTKHYRGGGVVCFPSSSQDVACVLKYCNDNRIGVVPQGGNTGLVGGGVGMGDELILSTSRMRTIHSIDAVSGVLECDAGCILQDLMSAVADHNMMIPLDLGSKGSCAIGGNVSTNAGGLRVIRYGSMHSNVMGLEVVLADGRVLDMMRALRKDNSGYHLHHMFVGNNYTLIVALLTLEVTGSEGTLGVVTRVAISLVPRPSYSRVALVKVSSFDKVTELLHASRNQLGETLSAFEFIDSAAIEAVREVDSGIVHRLGDWMEDISRSNVATGALFVLLEVSSASASEKRTSIVSRHEDSLERFLNGMLQAGVVSNGVLSESASQEGDIWSLRENVPVALARLCRNGSSEGPLLFKYDISVPRVGDMLVVAEEVRRDFLADGFSVAECHDLASSPITQARSEDIAVLQLSEDETRRRRECVLRLYCYGHAGDQNLHLNVMLSFATERKQNVTERKLQIQAAKKSLEQAVLRAVNVRKGSISAEHGVGQQKSHLLGDVRSENEMGVMRALKSTLDPNWILNPGKVLLAAQP